MKTIRARGLVQWAVAALMCVMVVGTFAGCGSKAAVAEVYDSFRSKVRAGDYSGAWAMLTEDSQKSLGSEAEFKAVLEKIKDTTFAETSAIRDTIYVGGDDRMSQGKIYLLNENGGKTGEAGTFTAFRDGNNWKVMWTLSRNTESSSEIPGGAAPSQ